MYKESAIKFWHILFNSLSSTQLLYFLLWILQMINLLPSLNQTKSRDKEGFKGVREWAHHASETAEQREERLRRRRNRDIHVSRRHHQQPVAIAKEQWLHHTYQSSFVTNRWAEHVQYCVYGLLCTQYCQTTPICTGEKWTTMAFMLCTNVAGVVAQQPKASYHEDWNYLDGLFFVNLLAD